MAITSPDLTPTTHLDTGAAAVLLTVDAWHDPLVETAAGAMRTDSDDALVWYTPTIGTIGMAMAHRFSRHASDGPSCWTIEDIARTFGIGSSAGRVWHSIDRLERFGIIRRTGDLLAVRLWLPPLPARMQAQLPGYLADAYTER